MLMTTRRNQNCRMISQSASPPPPPPPVDRARPCWNDATISISASYWRVHGGIWRLTGCHTPRDDRATQVLRPRALACLLQLLYICFFAYA